MSSDKGILGGSMPGVSESAHEKYQIMQGFETAFSSRLPKPQDQVRREQKKLACEQAITQLIYDLEAEIGQEVVIGTILCQRKAQGNGHIMAHETRIELGV